METIKETIKMPLRELLTKRPFTRIMPDGHYDHGEFTGEVKEESPVTDFLLRKRVTQEDFLRELDPCGHLINDREYYPDIWRKSEDGLWYLEEVPRYSFAYQWIILQNQLTHLTGNDVQFELAEEESEEHLDVFSTFKAGWADKNMEVAWYQFAKSVKSTGDAAFVAYLDNGEFGWKVLSFLNGDRLFPHYDNKTGKLSTFARTYSNFDEEGRISKRYIDVWDNKYYYRFVADGDPKNTIEKVKQSIFNFFNIDGYKLEYAEEHGFDEIPVSYQRDDFGPCWTLSQETIDNYEMAFSRLAQSNHNFGLPIMYVKGEGSQEVSSKDMSHASKVFFLPSDGEMGFLNRQDASNAYKTELDILENQIYSQSNVVKTPELKSGDLPAAAIKLLYTPAYNKAMSDSNEYALSLDKIVYLFKFGFGIESLHRLDFMNTRISHFIKPYVHLNETELTTNLSMQVQNGFLSKQTASEKSPYATPREWDRIIREKKEEQQQELLLEEQRLEIQSVQQVDTQEQLSEINTEQQIEVAKAENQLNGNQQTTDKKTKKVKSHKGSSATGRGRGRTNRSGRRYDENGNWEGRNNWDNWNRNH